MSSYVEEEEKAEYHEMATAYQKEYEKTRYDGFTMVSFVSGSKGRGRKRRVETELTFVHKDDLTCFIQDGNGFRRVKNNHVVSTGDLMKATETLNREDAMAVLGGRRR